MVIAFRDGDDEWLRMAWAAPGQLTLRERGDFLISGMWCPDASISVTFGTDRIGYLSSLTGSPASLITEFGAAADDLSRCGRISPRPARSLVFTQNSQWAGLLRIAALTSAAQRPNTIAVSPSTGTGAEISHT